MLIGPSATTHLDIETISGGMWWSNFFPATIEGNGIVLSSFFWVFLTKILGLPEDIAQGVLPEEDIEMYIIMRWSTGLLKFGLIHSLQELMTHLAWNFNS